MRPEIAPALRWILLAIAGVIVAIAVGLAASELTSQRIGLSSEPLRAGEALAPSPAGEGREKPHSGGRGEHSTTTTAPETTTAPTTTTPPPVTTPDDSAEGEDVDDD